VTIIFKLITYENPADNVCTTKKIWQVLRENDILKLWILLDINEPYSDSANTLSFIHFAPTPCFDKESVLGETHKYTSSKTDVHPLQIATDFFLIYTGASR
jgi:hypothetical protein